MLEALGDAARPAWLRAVEAVPVLRQIGVQQFYQQDERIYWREENTLPPAAQGITSPYDPQARYGTKRSTTWIGYKVHLPETGAADAPHLVTQGESTIATGSDYDPLPPIQQDLAQHDLLPAEHFVAGGYVDAGHVVTSQAQGSDLVGPASENQQWQEREGTGCAVEHFAVDGEAQAVTCPQGQRSVKWKSSHDRHGQPVIDVEFARRACLACPVRAPWTRAAVNPRSLTLRPQAHQEALQAARARQQTAAFKARYAVRAGIEGTLSQAVRVFDVRHARYSGPAKTHVQHILTATALNVVRLVSWLDGTPRAQTRSSPFVALMRAAA